MAGSINVNQNNNNVDIQDQNGRLTITDNNAGTTVNVTQPISSIVTVSAIGPQGPVGPIQTSGSFTGSFSGSFTGSLQGTASNAVSASYALTASYVENAQTASYVLQAVSASFAQTASYALNVNPNATASYAINALSASYAQTASYVQNAQTASYVQNAQTASYVLQAVSASFATTASYVQNAQTASYVLQAVSASFATSASQAQSSVSASYALSSSYAISASQAQSSVSASYALNATNALTASYLNTLNQNLTFNGNLTLNGTASIANLVVNQIAYSSGSNQLGDAANDTQTLWGTVDVKTGPTLVTGSLNLNGFATGSVLFTSGSNGTITGSSNLFWDNTNSGLIIGGGTLDTNVAIQVNSVKGIRINGAGAGYGFTLVRGSETTSIANNSSLTVISSTQKLTFVTAASERLRIVESGNVLIGTTTDSGYRLDVSGSLRVGTPTAIPHLVFARTGSNYVTTPTGGSIAFNLANTANENASIVGIYSTGLRIGTGFSSISATAHIRGSGTTSATTALRVENTNASASLVVLDNGNVYSNGPGFIASNTAFGFQSLNNPSGSATQNASFGYQNFSANNYSGIDNVAIGYRALQNTTTGYQNMGIGTETLQFLTIGSGNTAVGHSVLRFATANTTNTGIGYYSLYTLGANQGNNNTGIGSYAFQVMTTGSNNIGIGGGSGAFKSGSFNIFIGASNNQILTGSGNVIIGNNQSFPSSLNNTIAISDGSGNMRIYVSSSGNIGIGTLSPSYSLDVSGSARITNGLLVTGGITGSFTGSVAAPGATTQIVYNSGSVLGADSGFVYSGSNVGIGIPSPGSYYGKKLVISAPDEDGITIASTSTSAAGALYFADGIVGNEAFRGYLSYSHLTDALRFGTAGTTKMTIASNGNVLIGTTTDSGFRLDVNGTARVSGTTSITPPSVTGADVTPSLNIGQTWNTTGNPILITADITDTASSSTAAIARFRVNLSSVLTLAKNGLIWFGNIGNSAIGSSAPTTGDGLAQGQSVTMLHTITSAAGYGVWIRPNSGNRTATSGESGLFRIGETFTPTSGTAVYNTQLINTTINQTGGANGITRGLFVNPTLTAAADFRAIETVTGNNLLNSTSGNTYIGLSANTGTSRLQVRGSGTTNATTTMRIENANASASLVVLDDGNVGVGTTTPGAKIEVSLGHIRLSDAYSFQWASQNNRIYNQANATVFINNANETLRIAGSGNVGIGTSTPTSTLDIRGTQTATGAIARTMLISSSLSASANNDVLVGLDINPSFNAGAFTGVTNSALRITQSTGSVEPLTINLASSPTSNPIVVRNSSNIILFRVDTIGNIIAGAYYDKNNLTNLISFPGNTFTTQINGVIYSRLYDTGNLLLQNGATGTDTGYRLTVNSSGSASGSLFISGSSNQPLLVVTSSAATALFVSGSGNVGIGTNTPGQQLTVMGNATFGANTPSAAARLLTRGAGTTSTSTSFRAENASQLPALRITDDLAARFDGKVGIGIIATASLDVAGTTRISGSFNTAISGSILTVQGSGSAQPIFTVQGSQGELFSITDSLSGSLFSVNDISGLPILEVFSDNTTLIGNYQDPMLITTAKVVQTNSGSFTVYSLPTASYDTAFFEYSIRSGSNARAGTIMAMQLGSTVNFTETTTTDFGSTSAVSFTVIVTGSNMALTGSSTTGSWTIKTIVRGL
jgi:hypothetical protein